MATDSLKLPPIPVPRGRSPGSSPDVRRRSKEREQQRKLRSGSDHHHILRLPRLFRGRSMSTTTASYLTHSLTNLSEIAGGAESSDDGGMDFCASPSQGSRKTSRNHDPTKWPVAKTLSAASAKQIIQHHIYHQTSASSTPGGRRSPKGSSPQATPISLTAPTDAGAGSGSDSTSSAKQRSQSHSHKLPFSFFGHGPGINQQSERHPNFKNIHDDKGNWIGFVQRKRTGDGQQPVHSWNNQKTFLSRARSADDILQLFVDDDL